MQRKPNTSIDLSTFEESDCCRKIFPTTVIVTLPIYQQPYFCIENFTECRGRPSCSELLFPYHYANLKGFFSNLRLAEQNGATCNAHIEIVLQFNAKNAIFNNEIAVVLHHLLKDITTYFNIIAINFNQRKLLKRRHTYILHTDAQAILLQ